MGKISFILFFLCSGWAIIAQTHPGLTLTPQGVKEIRAHMKEAPLFEHSVNLAIVEVEKLIADGIQVPTPKDLAGGYSHETHKRNFLVLPKAAALYQITGIERYAQYTKDVFLEYARLFPTWGAHPSTRSYAPGKIFWQCLNDANWLVYMSQAYDCIYEFCSEAERETLENNLFKPLCDYVSLKNPQFFNRIHNHSTWGNAGVGMMALAMGDEDLLSRALYGIKDIKLDEKALDNDGGVIKEKGQSEAGFFAQLDHSFSPDGYYSEGPYYQRYAMSPFITFAQALQNKKPELKIFEYRNGLLEKALYTLLNLTDGDGQFYPINDAQKGMSIQSRELVAAVNVIYSQSSPDASLLSIAKSQERVQLDLGGFQVAKALAKGQLKPFDHQSAYYSDGEQGEAGGVAVLRSKKSDLNLLFKFASQGMGHGHFDRLGYSLYEGSTEVLQDYGAARWVNIDQKSGGGYLPENKSWAKQTIAHNALVMDEKSHFKGSTKTGSAFNSQFNYFVKENSDFSAVNASDLNAYPDAKMNRTLVMFNCEYFEKPIVIDVLKVNSEEKHQLDLPYHFASQYMSSSVDPKASDEIQILGDDHGYQHAWNEASKEIGSDNYSVTWYTDRKFYTATILAESSDELILARAGANDPNFNIRRDAFFIHRKKDVENATFISVIAPHGSYSPVDEIPRNPYLPEIEVSKVLDDENYTIAELNVEGKGVISLMISHNDSKKKTMHQKKIENKNYNWQGPIDIKTKDYDKN